jgi:dTDP-4-amino-4,6-dideoxygalactose transaminase
VHLQPAYADLGYRPGDFPVAERFAARTLSLPMYPELSADQVARVAEVLCRVAMPA